MSSLIEKAALRLEQLRQAGVDLGPAADQPAPATLASPAQPAQTAAPVKPVPVSKQVNLDLAGLTANGFVTPNAPRAAIADRCAIGRIARRCRA